MNGAKNRLAPRVSVAAVSSPLEVGADRAADVSLKLADMLQAAGCEVVPLGPIGRAEDAVQAGRRLAAERVDACVISPVSWFEDYLVLDLLEECALPIAFWPLPGMETGALCGTQQTTYFLKQLGQPYGMVFGELNNGDCLHEAMTFLRAAALHKRLRVARVGLLGHRVHGMTHTAPNEASLKRNIGPRVLPLDLAGLLARAREMPETLALAAWQRLARSAAVEGAQEADGVASMQLYAAMKELIGQSGAQALAVGCYPDLMGRVCLPASILADEGVPIACEGDVHGAIAMYMLSLLTDGPTHNTDLLDPADDYSLVFSHCGSSSFSLAERPADIKLCPVRLVDRGVCARFPGKPGPVTLVSLAATTTGYQCAILEGEAVPTEMVFRGNPLRVRFDEPVQRLIQWMADEGIPHHWMIGYGHVSPELRAWARICGPDLRVIEA